MDDLYMQKAEIQYKKYPEIDRQQVFELLEWIEKEPELPNISEYELIHFYHSCYCDQLKTKDCIKKYYMLCKTYPKMFGFYVIDENLRRAMGISAICPLPGLSPDGYKVLYMKIIDSDYTKVVTPDHIRLFAFVVESLLAYEDVANGFIILNDMNGFVLGHLSKLRPYFIRIFFSYLQEALPVRLKGIHILNTGWLTHQLLTLVKPFLSRHVLDILHLHKNPNTLGNYVSIEMLPNECGGNAGSLIDLTENFYKKMSENTNCIFRR